MEDFAPVALFRELETTRLLLPLLLFSEEETAAPSSFSASLPLSFPLALSLAIMRHACLKVDNECSVSLEAGETVAIITVRASGKANESFKACIFKRNRQEYL